MVVVDDLDERLDAAALLDHLLTHAAGDLQGVALDTGDDGVGEGVRLGARVLRLDNDDLYIGEKRWSALVRCRDIPLSFGSSLVSFVSPPSSISNLGHIPALSFIPPIPPRMSVHIEKFRSSRIRKIAVVPSYRRNGHG